MTVKVSVLTPVYNAEPFLAEAIESILTQTFEDFEFLLIDDGSSDGSAGILRYYSKRDKRIRVMTLPHNRGMPYALNYGLQKARAPLIARVDADDISLPEHLQTKYDYLSEHPEVGVVGCQLQYFTYDETAGKKVLLSRSFVCPTNTNKMDVLYQSGYFPTSHIAMFRSALAREVGGYREFFRHGGEYLDFFQRMWDKSTIRNLPETLFWCRHEASTSTFFANHNCFAAGTCMAMLCALYRQAGRDDPIAAVKDLADLPAYLGLPPSVTLEALQRSPYWAMGLVIEHLQRSSLALPVRARLYGRLADLYRRRRNFPNRRIYWRRYIFYVTAGILASIAAFPLRVRRLWA